MNTKNSSVRILVADDSEVMRNGLRSLLQSRSDWVICGEATDGKEAVKKAVELQPDVILVDMSMPQLNGFEVARCIHERAPQSEILIVTEHDSRFFAHVEAPSGVRGYVLKSRLSHDLESAVDAASKHQSLSNKAVSGSL